MCRNPVSTMEHETQSESAKTTPTFYISIFPCNMPRSQRKPRHSLSTEPDHATTAMVIGLGVTNSLLLPVLGLCFPAFGDFLFQSAGLHCCIVLFVGILALMTLLIGFSVHRVRKLVVIGVLGIAATLVPLLPWFDGCCSIYKAVSAESGQVIQASTFAFPLLTLAGHAASSVAVELNRRLLMQRHRQGTSQRKSK